MHIFILFATCIIFSTSSHAMDPQGKEPLRCLSPESLAVLMYSLNVSSLNNQNIQELTLLIHSLNVNSRPSKPQSKLETIANLAIKLNLCLIKDEGYYREIESLSMDFFPKKEHTYDATSKAELAQLTRDALKNIVRLTKNSSPQLPVLEQAIHQIPAFNLKYLLSTQGLPLVIEDSTSRFKQEMLMTLHS